MLKERFLNVKPEKIFLFYAIIFGFSFLIVTPPYQAPDENYHFFQALTVSEFYSNSQDGIEYIPEFFIKIDSSFSKIPFKVENKIYASDIISLLKQGKDTSNIRVPFKCPASHYSFMLYIPQVIGLWTGQLFSAPPIIVFYMGRMFAMLSWILLIYFAIKIIQLPKWLFILIVLTPISLFQGVSFSADSVLNSVSFLLIAIILRHSFDNQKTELNLKDIIIIILLSVIVTMSKPPYLILLFAYFLIPYKKLNSKSKYYLYFLIIISINLILIYIWNVFVKTPISSDLSDKKDHISFILNNPVGYMRIFAYTLYLGFPKLAYQFVGKLGWLDVELPDVIVVLYLIIIIFIAFYDKSGAKININLKQKFLILSIFIADIIVIFTIFYFLTPKESNIINGIQSRYFIPFHPLLFLLFYNFKFELKEKWVKLIVIIISFITLFSSLISLIFRYYN